MCVCVRARVALASGAPKVLGGWLGGGGLWVPGKEARKGRPVPSPAARRGPPSGRAKGAAPGVGVAAAAWG